MQTRYDLRSASDGTWTVVDRFTDWPAIVAGVCLIGLDLDDADDAVDLLNWQDVERRQYDDG